MGSRPVVNYTNKSAANQNTIMLCALLGVLLATSPAFAQYPGGNSGVETGTVASPTGDATEGQMSPETAKTSSTSASNTSQNSPSTTGINPSNQPFKQHLGQHNQDRKFTARQQFFIKELKLQFAERQYIERETGLPASWSHVERYLEVFQDETERFEKNPAIFSNKELMSLGKDVMVLNRLIDDEIDKNLDALEQKQSVKSTGGGNYVAPKSLSGMRYRLEQIKHKIEIVEFASKTFEAMGIHSRDN